MATLLHPRRAWSLWLLCLILALLGSANLALAFDHLRRAAYYRNLGVSYPPELRAALAVGWGGALLALAWGLIRRRRWARRWTLIVLSNYGVFGVLWLLAFARSDYGRERFLFRATLTALLVLLAGGVLWRHRTPAGPDPPPTDHIISLEQIRHDEQRPQD